MSRDKDETIYTTVYDDLSPTFQYTGFENRENFGNGYFNGTNHLSKTGSSTMRFS